MEEQQVRIAAKDVSLEGDLLIPARPIGLVLFAHGSGSSRHSPRNRQVAGLLRQAGLAALLIDLLTVSEEVIDRRMGELRFDIELLARRLSAATDWTVAQAITRGMRIGLFGSSTGAAAALIAAAERPGVIGAVVSRGGRPDLAARALDKVLAPTLLIVGGEDKPVIGMNQAAMVRMRCPVLLEIVPGASHLFEERGALETVARLASDWFVKHLSAGGNGPGITALSAG